MICFGRLYAGSGVICLSVAGVEAALKHRAGARAVSRALWPIPSVGIAPLTGTKRILMGRGVPAMDSVTLGGMAARESLVPLISTLIL